METRKKLGRKRIVPWTPHKEVQTALPAHGAFVSRKAISHKSGLDFPELPVYRSIGPGTPEYNATYKILPIDPPHANLVDTLNSTQRHLVEEFEMTQLSYGGPLKQPRMPMPVEPPPTLLSARSPRRISELTQPLSARTVKEATITSSLPQLFTGGRTPAQNRHLVAVSRNGERLKPPAPTWKGASNSGTGGPGSPSFIPSHEAFSPTSQGYGNGSRASHVSFNSRASHTSETGSNLGSTNGGLKDEISE